MLTTCDKSVAYCVHVTDNFNTLLTLITECHVGIIILVEALEFYEKILFNRELLH